MLVRRAVRSDIAMVRGVHLAAFATADGTEAPEAGLAAQLGKGPWFLPELSLVVAVESGVVGHVIMTRGTVEPDGRPALGLGPLGVVPTWQRRGVGSALMHAVLGAAEARDETLVCLLGSPRYYCRFGFRPAVEVGVAAPDPAWGGAFQARVLKAGAAPTGTFRYAAPFDALS